MQIIQDIADLLWSFPVLLFILGISALISAYLGFMQIRCLFAAIKETFAPQASLPDADAQSLTPFQAFMNILGGNIGNGALAGVPTAIAFGGPGSIFWMMIMSTFAAVLRFAEVYIAVWSSGRKVSNDTAFGPMRYLQLLPFGLWISFIFGVFALMYSFVSGNMTQCHAVAMALYKAWGIAPYITGLSIGLFVMYLLQGGAGRIVSVLNTLVPLKIGLFLLSAGIILVYHVAQIPHALYLMYAYAFSSQALFGGAAGFAVQEAMKVGFQRGFFAHEAGLGTASIAFGDIKNPEPAKNALTSLLSVFITTHIVCFLVALTVLVSGVWDNGETSSALIISAYETVFGSASGLIITFLTINFGMSVLVAYAYIGKLCWDFITQKRFAFLFSLVYAAWAYIGCITDVKVVWALSDIINAGMFFINLLAVIWFLPEVKRGLQLYLKSEKS
jgi:AGCS family alanine or glycine:cation symporter